MLGLLTWIVLGEPVTLRPGEIPPWTRWNLFVRSHILRRDAANDERQFSFSEDSMFGVCDPAAYGFRQTDRPRSGDIACWHGDRGLLARLSRYVSGCRFSHQGTIISDGVVGHITLGGWCEEPVPEGVLVFDCGRSDAERSAIAAYWVTAERPVGYGYHSALLVALLNIGCYSQKSNVFHLLDTMTLSGLLWFASLPWLAGVWVAVALIRVTINYGTQRPRGGREAT